MRSFSPALIITVFWVLGSVEQAFALQTHGAAEGLYAHQLAHLFFALCMGIFAYRIRRTSLPKNQGWQWIAWGSILLMVWNLWAFIGHFVTLLIPEERFFLPEGKLVPRLFIGSWKEILYYVLNMDHLVCVPALVFIYMGLRRILSALHVHAAIDRCE